MAILNKIILGACALASIVEAHPVRVMFTVTDVVTVTTVETVNAVSTIWLPASESPAAATTSASSVEQTPTPTPVVQLQQAVNPSPSPFTAAPVASSPQPSTLQASPTSTGAVPRAASPSGAVAGGQCEGAGATCTGDVTHWEGGLGACGWDVNTASDMQIALPVGLMGSQSNGNPYCGRSVTLKDPNTGITVQATVGDKCMGCTGASIDCTSALFTAITGGKGDGRESGIQWWFN